MHIYYQVHSWAPFYCFNLFFISVIKLGGEGLFYNGEWILCGIKRFTVPFLFIPLSFSLQEIKKLNMLNEKRLFQSNYFEIVFFYRFLAVVLWISELLMKTPKFCWNQLEKRTSLFDCNGDCMNNYLILCKKLIIFVIKIHLYVIIINFLKIKCCILIVKLI